MSPLISVIIPVYNGDRYLAAAIESILQQTYSPREIIIIDDGSTDKTAEVAQTFPVQYHRQDNAGSSAARNHGIAVASGEFIAFLDADDLWLPEKLKLQVQAFQNCPNLDLVFGHIQQFISPDLTNLPNKIHCPSEPQPGYSPCTVLIKATAFEQVGLFDESLQKAEFIDWYTRAQDCGLTTLMLQNILAMRRIHTANKSVQNRDMSDFLRVVRASLQRRRNSE
ncbi:MAG: glycosyltransferase family A protein [Oscillatoria sp. PMC 1068.18]|nr:glycosyltransferase family A protein [Oscillatoria sp. PMC 1076.18]MEC4988174.1 glycosyltransferase family A protein [Oscillatoria sp. PMC 1068.18]